jgi:hypothetical protein
VEVVPVSDPVFTFAIVNWNTSALLRNCLNSIAAVKGEWDIQVLVADNASSDGSAEMVRTDFPWVTLVENDDNVGFARGHLPLFQLSRGRYHVLVNSDVRLMPGCLTRWEALMRARPEIGVLGCKIMGPDGELQPSCRRFPSLGYQLMEASGIGRLLPNSRWFNGYKMGDFDHQHSRAVDQVMGSLFLIRADLMAEIGYLDTGFFMYYEEVDYCKRCHQAGYQVYYDARSTVFHEGGGSSRRVRVLTIRRAFRSMGRYFRKHLGWWTYLPLLAILSLDGVTHVAYALLRRGGVWATAKAYGLGWWDVLTFRKASF